MEIQDKISEIRRKVIKANPDLSPTSASARCNCKDCAKITIKIDRPIRLADILLAINAKEDMPYFTVSTFGELMVNDVSQAEWNLRQDDLTLQSPETITFIHDILK